MAIQDNSWLLEEMNYTLSLVVAVPELEVIPCLLWVLLSERYKCVQYMASRLELVHV